MYELNDRIKYLDIILCRGGAESTPLWVLSIGTLDRVTPTVNRWLDVFVEHFSFFVSWGNLLLLLLLMLLVVANVRHSNNPSLLVLGHQQQFD